VPACDARVRAEPGFLQGDVQQCRGHSSRLSHLHRGERMSEFDDALDEALGDAEVSTDIRVIVRRCWFYDFHGYPTRVWDGRSRLHSSDGNVSRGTVLPDGKTNIHKAPRSSDGRDGSSKSYEFTMGGRTGDVYNALKPDQDLVAG